MYEFGQDARLNFLSDQQRQKLAQLLLAVTRGAALCPCSVDSDNEKVSNFSYGARNPTSQRHWRAMEDQQQARRGWVARHIRPILLAWPILRARSWRGHAGETRRRLIRFTRSRMRPREAGLRLAYSGAAGLFKFLGDTDLPRKIARSAAFTL